MGKGGNYRSSIDPPNPTEDMYDCICNIYILKYQHISSKRQLLRFLIKLFLAAQSFFIKFDLFVFLSLFFYFAHFSIPFAVRHHLQSDTRGVLGRPMIYAPGDSEKNGAGGAYYRGRAIIRADTVTISHIMIVLCSYCYNFF